MHKVHRLTLQCTLQASDQQFWVLTGLQKGGSVRLEGLSLEGARSGVQM